MKLLIDIPDDYVEEFKMQQKHLGIEKEDIIESAFGMARYSIANGIPLEDIKAEIKEEKNFAYADFERYKVECLGQDWEDVYDSLPQDDFRYGMERALEIINKHIKENKE